MYRKDFTQLSSAELTRLAAGFNHLWSTGVIQNNANLHDVNFNGGIIHWSPAFLPWHRWFLRDIEQQLQAFDPLITLPYWDWTRADSRDLDTGVWQSFFGGRSNTGGNFDHWTYNRASGTGGNSLPTHNDLIQELKETTYFDYRAIESGSHVPGHTWTGGTMASGQSPLDPLFYLHHCNLDRLWAIWQQNNPGVAQYDPTIGLSSDITPNSNVPGLNQSMQVGTTATPASVLDHTSMGYLYERDVLLEIAWFISEGSSIQTGDPHPADLFIPDSSSDTGAYPSPVPHWSSPDIWVRNDDPSTPGEDPDLGHQVPIVNQVNYLYVKVTNRGGTAASGISVEAFHCNPGTGMLWPNDFNSMGVINVPGAIAPGGDQRVGPFLWTPTVVDHECLLAIVNADNDPNTVPVYYQPVPHWHIVRFDNSVGQRNVSPAPISPGGSMSMSLRVRGGLTRTSNNLEFDAQSIPADTTIQLTIANSIADMSSFENARQISQNSRYTTLEMSGESIGRMNGFELAAQDDKTVKLLVNFSIESTHEQIYPLLVSQYQDGNIAGKMTINLIAIKESEDYVYGNPNSKELHTIHCPFWDKILDKNKIPFREIRDGLNRGYNGCRFCLSEYDTG